MIAPRLETQFVECVGTLWHEIKGAAWHTTSPEAFARILADGEIRPGPTPAWMIDQGVAPCFSAKIGAVSVFDFAGAGWNDMEPGQVVQWCPFFKGYRSKADPVTEIKTSFAIEIDRSKAPGWRTVEETLALWKEELSLRPPPGNVIPRHETCHDGPIPISACRRAINIRSIGGRVLSYAPVSLMGTSG